MGTGLFKFCNVDKWNNKNIIFRDFTIGIACNIQQVLICFLSNENNNNENNFNKNK